MAKTLRVKLNKCLLVRLGGLLLIFSTPSSRTLPLGLVAGGFVVGRLVCCTLRPVNVRSYIRRVMEATYLAFVGEFSF